MNDHDFVTILAHFWFPMLLARGSPFPRNLCPRLVFIDTRKVIEKRMKRNRMILIAMAALAAGMAFAQTTATPAASGQSGLKLRAAVRQRILKKLNLTADQKTQAKAILQQARTAAAPLRTQLQTNREALAAAVKSNDTGQIQSLAAAQGSLQGQVLAIRSAANAKFYALLTPDQQTLLAQMQAKAKGLKQQLKEF